MSTRTPSRRGGLFQLSARLARYTGNQTYADWAEKTFQWLYNSPILDKSLKDVWDGTSMVNNCSDATHVYWTYNAGTLVMGSAYMANFVSSSPLLRHPRRRSSGLAADSPFRRTATKPGWTASTASSTRPTSSSCKPPAPTRRPRSPSPAGRSCPKWPASRRSRRPATTTSRPSRRTWRAGWP